MKVMQYKQEGGGRYKYAFAVKIDVPIAHANSPNGFHFSPGSFVFADRMGWLRYESAYTHPQDIKIVYSNEEE